MTADRHRCTEYGVPARVGFIGTEQRVGVINIRACVVAAAGEANAVESIQRGGKGERSDFKTAAVRQRKHFAVSRKHDQPTATKVKASATDQHAHTRLAVLQEVRSQI